jgi:hypothetical protein
VSHSAFAHDLFCVLSLGLVFISNANPSRSFVYICKFQFRPIHPPLGDFHNPSREDLMAVKDILHAFVCASGLVINLEKCSIHPIRCDNIDLDHVLQPFQGTRGTFPCRYLGLQLHTRAPQRIHVQPLIEKIRNRLAEWKGSMLNRAGRLMLMSFVLSAMPTYHLSVFPFATWARKRIDRIHCSFL